jgi:hypothetical protein
VNLWTIIVGLIDAVVTWLTSLLPSWEPVDFEALAAPIVTLLSETLLADALAWLNLYGPVAEAFTLFAASLTIYAGYLLYKATMFMLVRLRIVGGTA